MKNCLPWFLVLWESCPASGSQLGIVTANSFDSVKGKIDAQRKLQQIVLQDILATAKESTQFQRESSKTSSFMTVQENSFVRRKLKNESVTSDAFTNTTKLSLQQTLKATSSSTAGAFTNTTKPSLQKTLKVTSISTAGAFTNTTKPSLQKTLKVTSRSTAGGFTHTTKPNVQQTLKVTSTAGAFIHTTKPNVQETLNVTSRPATGPTLLSTKQPTSKTSLKPTRQPTIFSTIPATSKPQGVTPPIVFSLQLSGVTEASLNNNTIKSKIISSIATAFKVTESKVNVTVVASGSSRSSRILSTESVIVKVTICNLTTQQATAVNGIINSPTAESQLQTLIRMSSPALSAVTVSLTGPTLLSTKQPTSKTSLKPTKKPTTKISIEAQKTGTSNGLITSALEKKIIIGAVVGVCGAVIVACLIRCACKFGDCCNRKGERLVG